MKINDEVVVKFKGIVTGIEKKEHGIVYTVIREGLIGLDYATARIPEYGITKEDEI